MRVRVYALRAAQRWALPPILACKAEGLDTHYTGAAPVWLQKTESLVSMFR